jgi:hypothetical protein
LKAAIAELPDEMPVQGYDGSDRICPVSVSVNDYSDYDVEGDKPPPTLIIDVD